MTSIHISHNVLLWIGHIMCLASEGIGEINDKWVKQQWSYEYSIYEIGQGRYIRIVAVQGRRKRHVIFPKFKENKGWANIARNIQRFAEKRNNKTFGKSTTNRQGSLCWLNR